MKLPMLAFAKNVLLERFLMFFKPCAKPAIQMKLLMVAFARSVLLEKFPMIPEHIA